MKTGHPLGLMLALMVAIPRLFLGSQDACGSSVISLDGAWLLATDQKDVGKALGWRQSPRAEAKPTQVPGVIQETFPGYHGLAWYWRDFTPPANPHAHGRCLLKFHAVDYKAEVWLNGIRLGDHEGGETPFLFDATQAIKPGQPNRLAVRVLNPTDAPIDGITLNETPHGYKVASFSAGRCWNSGGICDSVELLLVPAVRIDDLFVRPDWKSSVLRVKAEVNNTGPVETPCRIECAVSPAAGGETLATAVIDRGLTSGNTPVEVQVQVPQPRQWALNDPFLYRVTVRVQAGRSDAVDEQSVRCGFRDFRFQNGCFRLNGRRIYLRCAHTVGSYPVGLSIPHDPDLPRRDLINLKAMGFNAVRFIARMADRRQLDLCDEIGLLVYEESYASVWYCGDSPQLRHRFDAAALDMVRRDRNHPSVVMWGLLNEIAESDVFRHGVEMLPAFRAVDDTRVVMLNSGRCDLGHSHLALTPGAQAWTDPSIPAMRPDPCVALNSSKETIGYQWQPGQLALQPGLRGEYSVVRWTAPKAGTFNISARFAGIAGQKTTHVYAFHGNKSLFSSMTNAGSHGNEAVFTAPIVVQANDTVDCIVGTGAEVNPTSLVLALTSSDGKSYNAAGEFSHQRNPNGVWTFGWLAPAPAPQIETFRPYTRSKPPERVGTLSNPGSNVWEDVLGDGHPYNRVPHSSGVISYFRNADSYAWGANREDRLPHWFSECGISSGVNLIRIVRQFEQLGKSESEDAQYYRARRDEFLVDWQQWRMEEAFGRPEDFLAQSLVCNAGQRRLDLNAIRANPHIVGHSMTAAIDEVGCGEGPTTTFRELKPGMADMLFDAWAPLRLCLFVEPVNVYRKTPVRLEAVLANEDALPPGKYPVRVEVFGPNAMPMLHRTVTVTIPDRSQTPEPPLAIPIFGESVPIDGPTGKYRFVATFERGAAAAGGEAEFHVADPADMPAVQSEVVLWGDDPGVAKWLRDHGVPVRPFSITESRTRQVILASEKPPAPGGAKAFGQLAERIARGSTVIFLSSKVFAEGVNSTAWLPLAKKGKVADGMAFCGGSWYYHKDEWAKRHPIFDGLPAGGLMDYTFYREIIPDEVWSGQAPPLEAVAGGNNVSMGYTSGLMVAVYPLGEGRFVLNTLRIRENLGDNPVAERLLRNMLRYAARDVGKPLATVPAGFDQQLRVMGLQSR